MSRSGHSLHLTISRFCSTGFTHAQCAHGRLGVCDGAYRRRSLEQENRQSGSFGSMFGGIDGESLVQVYNESVDFMYKDQARCLAAFGGHFGYDDRRQRTIFSGTTRSGHTKPANLWILNCP